MDSRCLESGLQPRDSNVRAGHARRGSRTPAEPESARDTVAADTPARWATSLMVVAEEFGLAERSFSRIGNAILWLRDRRKPELCQKLVDGLIRPDLLFWWKVSVIATGNSQQTVAHSGLIQNIV